MKNLKFIPIFLVLFVAFIASDSFADKPYTKQYIATLPADFDAFCKGERLVGDLDFKMIEHYNKDGLLTKATWVPLQGGYLVGDKSGDIYMAKGPASMNFDYNPGAQTHTTRFNMVLIGKGQSLIGNITIRYVITPNGVTTVDVFTRTDRCK
jgi:hypothetical protein